MDKVEEIPVIEEKSASEVEELKRIILASSLPQHVKDFIIKCISMALWFPHILERKNISLSRLRKMLFGKGYKGKKKSKDIVNNTVTAVDAVSNAMTPVPTEDSEMVSASKNIEKEVNSDEEVADAVTKSKKFKPGHGRNGHAAYEASHEIRLGIEGFSVGSLCPHSCGGKLYEYNPQKPRVLIRIKGGSFANIYKYTVERLRCNVCDYLIQADIPKEVGDSKYDASFKSSLAIQKYFVAVPFYRQEALQKLLRFPLPDSTQWDLVEQVAGCCYKVFGVLKSLAANGERIHNDDTSLRILQIIQEVKNNPDRKRKGMFTSGFIAENDGRRIALFLNGVKHSGENLRDILEERDKDKPPIIQMCDGLSCNIPKGFETIMANCLSHGFRKFAEVVDFFPVPCITIMRLLSQVYKEDEQTAGMTGQERLQHHQKHSQEIMDSLQVYLQALFDERQVEPNSELGKAIKYMQKHWDKLTRFLSVAGAPLCNNIIERALKIAIRNRKSALFYRTLYSADIGGMLTSIIYTCHLAGENPHHYLTALQEYTDAVRQAPNAWLPWNYRQTLESTTNDITVAKTANQMGDSAALAALVGE